MGGNTYSHGGKCEKNRETTSFWHVGLIDYKK